MGQFPMPAGRLTFDVERVLLTFAIFRRQIKRHDSIVIDRDFRTFVQTVCTLITYGHFSLVVPFQIILQLRRYFSGVSEQQPLRTL